MLRSRSSCDRNSVSWISTLTVFLTTLLVALSPPVAAEKTAADYFVHSLPGQPDGPLLRQHAGHIEVNAEHNGNLFFWFYHNQHIADRRRTVIWLNGGPGCSSEDGALMEIGPYRVRKDGKLVYNDGSWDAFANLLFVDNPVGTGFSYVNTDSYLHELQEMADQFLIFMEKWFKLFPEYAMDDLYIAGESYAGQHIPYIAKAVSDRNQKNQGQEWNLKGLLIGNGWISPPEQYQAYLPFAYANGLIQGGTPAADRVEKQVSQCLQELNKPGAATKVSVGACESILNVILEQSRVDNQCYNMYDVRLKDEFPACGMNWPPDLNDVTTYLRRSDVTSALHINPDKRAGWQECSGAVSAAFRAANSPASITLLPGLLESGIEILLFSGAKDLICSHIGTEDLIANMKWSGRTGFETSAGVFAPRRNWTFEGQPAGFYQQARNLTYVLINNSSHMVPFDYPRRSRDMLDRFMKVNTAGTGSTLFDSHIDGEPLHSGSSAGGEINNGTAVAEEQKQKLRQAELKAYYHSGEAALVVVIIGAGLFGLWVWRGRRSRHGDIKGLGSYMTVPGIGERFRDSANGHAAPGTKARDVEAQDFDESELDTLPTRSGGRGGIGGTGNRDRPSDLGHSPYDLASDSDDDDSVDGVGKKAER